MGQEPEGSRDARVEWDSRKSREDNPREAPWRVGQLGRGSLLGTLSSGPRQEVEDNGALWMTGSSCHHPICLLACGRRNTEGDRQGWAPLT